MMSEFDMEGGPNPFSGIFEEDPGVPGKKSRRVLFTGGMLGPMGYMNGQVYPFIIGPEEDYEEEEDPNP